VCSDAVKYHVSHVSALVSIYCGHSFHLYISVMVCALANDVLISRSSDSLARIGVRYFSLLQGIQPGCGAHQVSFQWLPLALSLGIRLWGREADRSPPSSAEIKEWWSYVSTPQYICLACA
jgi:hypothetical protein